MSKANDENNFVKAYGENEVSFQNFDENTDSQDQLQNENSKFDSTIFH